MKTVTLKIDDAITDKFYWLLEHFSTDEIKVLEQSEYISDDEYLRSIDGMAQSIKEARKEATVNGVGFDQLDW